MDALISTNLFLKKQKDFGRGKVRDIYNINDELLVLVASDRISAFDHVLPKPIPYKGQVLNQVASFFLDKTKDLVPNWKIAEPDPHTTIGFKCTPLPVEFVIRGYLAGHAWRLYNSGERIICGEILPEGLKENDLLPNPILTPTTKAQSGHDMDISKLELIKQNILKKEDLEQLEHYAQTLFKAGTDHAASQNLILADTKYEFGIHQGQFMLIDEIHTPDSSRYFYKDSYDSIQSNDQQQKQLSKEFVRQWLIENGFQGLEGQVIPDMSLEFINIISNRYIELYEQITGNTFIRRSYSNISESIEGSVNSFISNYYDI